MLRQLVRSFQRIVLTSPVPINANCTVYLCRLAHSKFFEMEHSLAAVPVDKFDDDIGSEMDYVKPYTKELEQLCKPNAIIEALRSRFRLSNADVEHLLCDESMRRSYRQRALELNLETLHDVGISKRTFMEHPWLITLERVSLKKKLDLMQTIAIQDINHFAPFLRVTYPRLQRLIRDMKRESRTVPLGNRLYYISHKLNVDPCIVAKYLSKRLFIFEMPFSLMKENLNIMMDYKVSSEHILSDLWAFKYKPQSVKLRFERARRAHKDRIMPWMVRCTEPILRRSLQLTEDELKVLNGKTNNIEYLAERLGFNLEETKAIMNKHPLVYRVRVTKMKVVLDYMLGEAGFTRYDIAQVPRILCHGLKTTKKRLEELKDIGCRPNSLVILCLSKREYEKFLNARHHKYYN